MQPGRKPRGNLLLSALFMAAFLFFLSVALVVTNREDIEYTLFADDKMRCNLAADGMLDYSLDIMRNSSNWEERFNTWTLQFNSGAQGRVRYRPWVEPQAISGSNRFDRPAVASPSAGVEIIATGTSGLFSSERHLLLEEFRLADSVLELGGAKPHLFSVGTNGRVQVLTPGFIWEDAGSIPNNPLLGTVSSGGGALLHCESDKGTEPPKILDFKVISVGGIPMVGGAVAETGTQFPRGQGAFILELNQGKFSWMQLPDPGDQLVKSLVQPSITPDNGAASAEGWDKQNLDMDIIAVKPAQLSMDYSTYQGPRMEWYALTGQRAEVTDGQYICHGTHYFYYGMRFKNSQSPGGQVRTQMKKSSFFHEPCILACDLETKQWRVVLDYLIVASGSLEEPTIKEGPRPKHDSLVVLPGVQAYVHTDQAPDNSWWQINQQGLTISGLPKQKSLATLGAQVLYTSPRGDMDISPPLMALNDHDIAPYFPKFLPALSKNEPQLQLRWSIDQESLTGVNRDLYAVVRLVSNAASGSNTQKAALAHFDGVRWQILPAGLGRLLPGSSSYRQELDADYAGQDGPMIGQKLILGSYMTERPLLRRYVPVARWGT